VLPSNAELREKTPAELQARLLKTAAVEGLNGNALPWIRGGLDYINKAFYLANRLGLDDQPVSPHLANRNGAWSEVTATEQLIPACRVFNRIISDTAPTAAEVEHALDQLAAATANTLPGVAATTCADDATVEGLPTNVGPTCDASSIAEGAEGTGATAATVVVSCAPEVRMLDGAATRALPHLASGKEPEEDLGLVMLNLGLSTAQMLPDQATAPLDAACNDDPNNGGHPFQATASTAAAKLSKPQRPQRPRSTFDMTSVRRSARLAKKPALPAVQRAQRNLIRKLGLPADELRPI